MKVLLDECGPEPFLGLARHLLRGHRGEHVNSIWAGKSDVPLLLDAARAGYDMFVTNNLDQFNDPQECDAIRKSRLHDVTYELADGLDGLALACGALSAAVRGIVHDLESQPQQRLARGVSLASAKTRYQITNPATDPPSPYWP